MRIALAGNPNSGKTTMYNVLTGRNEKVGNWAGVTVDKIESPLRKKYSVGSEGVIIVDLPGAYSMSPFTSEESITSDYVRNARPDVIVNIVDSTNLSRSLFFTTQLLEIGIPVVVALNKTDITDKRHNKINTKLLSERLGCPVVSTSADDGKGVDKLARVALNSAGGTQAAPFVGKKATDRASAEKADRERFAFVNKIVSAVETRETKASDLGIQDKIDDILTNKWLGIPIFAVVMFLVFQISQSWLGAWIAEGIVFENGFELYGLVTLIDMLGAWVLVRYSFRGKRVIDAIVDLPFALPTAVSGITLTALYAPTGWIGRYLPFEVSYTAIGIYIALTFIGLPALEEVDKELEEVSASLGATRWQTFWKVIFPTVAPSLLAGFTMAFARAIGEYGSVVFIAGNMQGKTEILPLIIFYKLGEHDYIGATTVAVSMLVASFALLFFINMIQLWGSRYKDEEN